MPDKSAGLTPRGREIELDFIRGIAILMVIDFHSPGHSIILAPFVALGLTNFGWAGVDIFFVLSGFLVGGLLVKEWKLKGRIDAKRFLIRRAFKIWPQYYFYLFVMLATRHRTFRALIGNLLNIQNYTVGIAHTWTLAVEEHAYLLLVLILAIAARKRLQARHVFTFLAVLCVAVILNCFLESWLGNDAFTHTDTRVDGIFFGVLLAFLFHYAPAHFARLQTWWPLWCAIPVITLTYLRFIPYVWWSTTLLWFGADMSGVACLLMLYRPRPAHQRPILYRLMAGIGLYSYGIYLWHASVVDAIERIAPKLPRAVAPWWLALAPYVTAILLGMVVTKLIEFPALKLRDRLFPRRVDSAVGIPAELEAATGVTGPMESVSFPPA
jgi:peptidoglycan/LPS O-acetylase OafA/YrhL